MSFDEVVEYIVQAIEAVGIAVLVLGALGAFLAAGARPA